MPVPASKLMSTPSTTPKNYEWMATLTARVLSALAECKVRVEFPTRKKLNEIIGFGPISGSLSRVFLGISEGSSSGKPRPGAIALGWIHKHELDIDGVVEETYEITDEGQKVLRCWINENGPLPKMKDAKINTNLRYQEADGGEGGASGD